METHRRFLSLIRSRAKPEKKHEGGTDAQRSKQRRAAWVSMTRHEPRQADSDVDARQERHRESVDIDVQNADDEQRHGHPLRGATFIKCSEGKRYKDEGLTTQILVVDHLSVISTSSRSMHSRVMPGMSNRMKHRYRVSTEHRMVYNGTQSSNESFQRGLSRAAWPRGTSLR